MIREHLLAIYHYLMFQAYLMHLITDLLSTKNVYLWLTFLYAQNRMRNTGSPTKNLMQKFSVRFVSLLLLIGVYQGTCLAQIDSTYIAPFEQKFSVQASVSNKFLSLLQEYDSKSMRDFSVVPNTPVNIGLGFTWKNLSISGSYGFQFLRDKTKGRTHSFDFQYHYYARKFVVDLFVQNYRGYNKVYEDDDETFIRASDVQITQYGAHGMYVFNNRKFSYKAAYNLSEKQIKSAGGFLLGGGVFQSRMRSDSTLVLRKSRNQQDNFQFGVSGGYGYTWVIKKHFFVAGSLTIGVNIGADRIEKFGKQKLEVYPTFFPRGSAGYHADNWSIGVSAVVNTIAMEISGPKSTMLRSGTLQLTFVKRFDTHPKILNKLPKNIIK